MKEKEPVSLSRMAALNLGAFGYDPGKPDPQALAIPQGDEPCDYTSGGANGFVQPFGDLVAVPKPRKLEPSSQKQFLQSVQGFILSRTSE
jgi:hypothetical protein